jgi:hypothetical protein
MCVFFKYYAIEREGLIRLTNEIIHASQTVQKKRTGLQLWELISLSLLDTGQTYFAMTLIDNVQN